MIWQQPVMQLIVKYVRVPLTPSEWVKTTQNAFGLDLLVYQELL